MKTMRFILLAAGLAIANAAGGSFTYADSDTVWPTLTGLSLLGNPADNQCGLSAQSPIDVKTGGISGTGNRRLVTNYDPLATLQATNTGFGLKVSGDFGYFFFQQAEIDGKDELYQAKQFHVHFPSEHTIDGKLYDGELHVVHLRDPSTPDDSQYGAAVIGIMIEEGPAGTPDNAFLASLIGTGLPGPTDDPKDITGTVDLRDMYQTGAYGKTILTDWFRYEGGLTTPPCTEIVHWNLLNPATNKIVASKAQVDAFKISQGGLTSVTNRPVQPLNGRKVYKNTLNIWDGTPKTTTTETAAATATPAAATTTVGFVDVFVPALVACLVVGLILAIFFFFFGNKKNENNV